MGNFTRVSTKETTTSMGSQRVLRAYSHCARLSLPKRYRPQREPRNGTNPVVIAVAAMECLFVGIVLRLREEGGTLGVGEEWLAGSRMWGES